MYTTKISPTASRRSRASLFSVFWKSHHGRDALKPMEVGKKSNFRARLLIMTDEGIIIDFIFSFQ